MNARFCYIFLSLLLLIAGDTSYANQHHNSSCSFFAKNLHKQHQLKHSNSQHHFKMVWNNDVEFDEEFHNSDEQNDFNQNTLLYQNKELSNHWYFLFVNQIIFKDYYNNFKTVEPFSVHSNPIYLMIGVFRI